MAFKIQRVPRGLNELLSIAGGATPVELEERTRGTLELLQFYASTQLQAVSANNAAVVEANTLLVKMSAERWTVLFSASATFVKTATVTALRGTISLNRRTPFDAVLFTEELGPFGATETGGANFGGMLPYPLLCPPDSILRVTPNIIGTDANVNATIIAEFGLL